MDTKVYNYVYLTTNKLTNKKYVGDHSTNDLTSKRSRNYYGSGKLIIESVKKYGKSNFSKEILEYCSSKEEAFARQQHYINFYDTMSPNGYNLSPTGGNCVAGCHSDETKKKIGRANKGENNGMFHKEVSIETINKWKESHKNYRHSKGAKEKMKLSATGENNPMYGKNSWAAINSLRKQCEHCGFITTLGNYARYHGTKCKHKI